MRKCIEIECKSAFNKINSKWLPYKWDLNIYRGCEHGCKYCFAIYSHDYITSSESYFSDIFVKKNILEHVEREVKKVASSNECVNIGGVTDSYQPAEATYKFMPDILRLLIKHKIPTVISTKSNLILRDYELLAELASVTYLNIATTITAVDEDIRRLIEPNGAPAEERFKVLDEFRKTKANRGLHFMPITPFITDSIDNIDAIFAGAERVGATYLLKGLLNLKGKTREVFFKFVLDNFPDRYEKIQNLFRYKSAREEYRKSLNSRLTIVRRRYNVSTDYLASMREFKRGKEKEIIALWEEGL